METVLEPNPTFDQLPGKVTEIFGELKSINKILAELYKKQQPEAADQLLTIGEAATFLHLSVPTLYGRVSNSTIPHSKAGKRLYFSRKELTDWIKAGRRQTVSELEQETISETDNFLSKIKTR